MIGRFQGRDIIDRPSCPFCGMFIEKPKDLAARMPHEMPVGACPCGAVYACDVTGHNLGTAMIEALVFGCNGDWDLAWGLLPEDDYSEKIVEHYDFERHLIVHGGVYAGRRIAGTLYFIRLHQDVREVTEAGARQRLTDATSSTPSPPLKGGTKKHFTKKDIEKLVKAHRIHDLMRLAGEDKISIRHIKRLLYSVDKETRWRAAEALGKVSAVIAEKDPGIISRLLQCLFTSVSDTAASSWGSIDAIGDIIGNSPQRFGGYIPQLYPFAVDRTLLSDILRVLGNLAKITPDIIRKNTFHFITFLHDPDPEIRGYAAILLGNLEASEAKDEITQLLGDTATLEIYQGGSIERVTLGRVANEALSRL